MWQSVEIFNIFSKTKTFFKNLENCFLVENTKIQNASFSYKAATSEANVKTNGELLKQKYWNCLGKRVSLTFTTNMPVEILKLYSLKKKILLKSQEIASEFN